MTIKIYSTPSCTYCSQAKDYFKTHSLAYEEFDVASDTDRRKEMVEKSGQLGVPVIDVDGQIMVGFDEESFEDILKSAGGAADFFFLGWGWHKGWLDSVEGVGELTFLIRMMAAVLALGACFCIYMFARMFPNMSYVRAVGRELRYRYWMSLEREIYLKDRHVLLTFMTEQILLTDKATTDWLMTCSGDEMRMFLIEKLIVALRRQAGRIIVRQQNKPMLAGMRYRDMVEGMRADLEAAIWTGMKFKLLSPRRSKQSGPSIKSYYETPLIPDSDWPAAGLPVQEWVPDASLPEGGSFQVKRRKQPSHQ